MHHVAGIAGDDRGRRLAVVRSGGIEEPASVETEVDEVSADDAHRDGDALGGEFEGDAAG